VGFEGKRANGRGKGGGSRTTCPFIHGRSRFLSEGACSKRQSILSGGRQGFVWCHAAIPAAKLPHGEKQEERHLLKCSESRTAAG